MRAKAASGWYQRRSEYGRSPIQTIGCQPRIRPDGHCTVEADRHQSTGQHLPGAARHRVEIRHRLPFGPKDGERDAERGDTEEDAPERAALAPAPERHKQRPKDDVELLLDRKRPGVPERAFPGGGAEAIGAAPETDVGPEDRGGGHRGAVFPEPQRRHGEGCHHGRGDDDEIGVRRPAADGSGGPGIPREAAFPRPGNSIGEDAAGGPSRPRRTGSAGR